MCKRSQLAHQIMLSRGRCCCSLALLTAASASQYATVEEMKSLRRWWLFFKEETNSLRPSLVVLMYVRTSRVWSPLLFLRRCPRIRSPWSVTSSKSRIINVCNEELTSKVAAMDPMPSSVIVLQLISSSSSLWLYWRGSAMLATPVSEKSFAERSRTSTEFSFTMAAAKWHCSSIRDIAVIAVCKVNACHAGGTRNEICNMSLESSTVSRDLCFLRTMTSDWTKVSDIPRIS